MNAVTDKALLVVNADDFAYLPGVSRGVIEAHKNGIVTATGVMANTDSFLDDVELLREAPELDVGVHLNITHGPRLVNTDNRFPRNFGNRSSFMKRYVTGAYPLLDIEAEWRKQIERCQASGLRLWFLNSHEHVHMLPALFSLILKLAAEYKVPHVRVPAGRFSGALRPGRFVRSLALNTLRIRNARQLASPAPKFVGLNESGQLTEDSLLKIIGSLQPGNVYELMCHPGAVEARTECDDPALLGYHQWESELRALCSESVRSACEAKGIKLARYADLPQGEQEDITMTKQATNR